MSSPSPPPRRPPRFPTNGIAVFRFQRRGQVSIGFRGFWVRIFGPFGWNPIGWLRTNRNSFFETSLNLNWNVVETVLDGFPGAGRSNLMSIRLEIVLIKLEPISDPFWAAYSKHAVPPYGKMLQFGNNRPEKVKQFFRLKRLWVSPLSIEIAFSSF